METDMKMIKGLRSAPAVTSDPARKAGKIEANRAVRRAGERELHADLAKLAEEAARHDRDSLPDRFE
jgi:hypothetical protein